MSMKLGDKLAGSYWVKVEEGFDAEFEISASLYDEVRNNPFKSEDFHHFLKSNFIGLEYALDDSVIVGNSEGKSFKIPYELSKRMSNSLIQVKDYSGIFNNIMNLDMELCYIKFKNSELEELTKIE